MKERNNIQSKKKDQDGKLGRILSSTGFLLAAIGVVLLIAAFVGHYSADQNNNFNLTSAYLEENGTLTNPVAQNSSTDKNIDAMDIERKKVLFISSYDPTWVTYINQIEGMQSVFDASNIGMDVVNLDSYKHHSDEDIEEFTNLVRLRMKEENYSGIMVGDDAALKFVEEHHQEFFNGLPIIFFGINDLDYGKESAGDPDITGYLESDNIEDTIDLALKLLPDTKRIVGVFDDSQNSSYHYPLYKKAAANSKYRGITFDTINFSDYSVEDFKNKVSEYDEGTVILATSPYQDKDGHFYSPNQGVKIICSAAKVPVFRNAKDGYYDGLTGGKMNLFESTTRRAAESMRDVIRGKKKIGEIPLSEKMDSCYAVNYKVMERFDIPTSRLPKGTVVLEEPQNFNKTYGRFFYPLLIIIVGILLVLAGSRFDVRERIQAEQEAKEALSKLRYASEHDSLTNAVSRQASLHHMREDERLHEVPYVFYLLDADDLNKINENYGHDRGDQLLKETAEDLQAVVDENDGKMARYGGDEFLLIFFNRHATGDDPLTERIMKILRKKRTVGFDQIVQPFSVGIANSEEGIDPEQLIICADLAQTHAKENGKNTFAVFTSEMKEKYDRQESMKKIILDAIENDGLTMVYQPQVCTETGFLDGFEALVRMKDKHISPAVFIPIAETSGGIVKIGRMTTEMTIRQISEWRLKGFDVPPVSINYSPSQLLDTDYVDFLRGLLEKYDIPPEAVKIEITETLFMENNTQAAEFFNQLKNLGVKILLDDFGTGYSSLNYLEYIPADAVKIDKALLDTYMIRGKERFLKNVITLVHDLGRITICEGVETREQYEMLKTFGCDGIQGYYFGKPLDPEGAEDCMRRKNLLPDVKKN